jgi:cytochrome P450 PksS
VIGEMLGVEERDHTRLRAWSRVLVSPSASGERNAAKTARLQSVMQDFVGYLHTLCVRRQRAPQDDLVSALLAVRGAGEAADDRLTEEELYSMVLLIVVVGHETSVHMIANAVRNLLAQHTLWERLCLEPDLIPQAVEELIRFDGPVERAPIRFAACDIDWDGQTIRRGEAVSVVLASAHRDAAAYPLSDDLDLNRAELRHLGFGHGVHYCLGAPLARLQGRIALETLTRRLPTMALAVPMDALRWHSNPILHGVKRLPVRW